MQNPNSIHIKQQVIHSFDVANHYILKNRLQTRNKQTNNHLFSPIGFIKWSLIMVIQNRNKTNIKTTTKK